MTAAFAKPWPMRRGMADIPLNSAQSHGGAARTDCFDRHQSPLHPQPCRSGNLRRPAMAYYQYDHDPSLRAASCLGNGDNFSEASTLMRLRQS